MSFELKPYAPSRFANQGKNLEKLIERTAHGEIKLIRIPDAHAYGGAHFRSKVPFDYLGHIDGHPLALEAKETAEAFIRTCVLTRAKSQHQVFALREFRSGHRNCVAGYLILTAQHKLTWCPIESLEVFKRIGPDYWNRAGIRGLDLSKDKLDWCKLILGDSF